MDFYGRAAELATLLETFDACVRTSTPRVVTIVAETGVGKSRLVQRFYDTITTDERYDPAQNNYWPDAFQTPAKQLRVTPEMKGHIPAGPPRFWWVGARWSNPDERNTLASSALVELKKQLTLHAAITKSFASQWQQSLENVLAKMEDGDVRRDIIIESLTLLLQVNIPLSGVLIDMIKPAIDPWTGADLVYADEHEDEMYADLRTQLLQTFRAINDRDKRLPIVIWLDDAQWMDAHSREFFRQLYTHAAARKWPICFVATHWPREWAEYGRTTFLGRGNVLPLGEPAQSDMAALLRSQLPGLTEVQQALVLAKSVGNYLALLENIGQLLSDPAYFVDGNAARALSSYGEQVASQWETNRQQRIQQRFDAFDSTVRVLLARFSHIGTTFFRSVVRTYAGAHQLEYSEALVQRCVAPLTIVSELSPEFHEFRDRGYFSVAEQYFADWLYDDEHIGLTEALRSEVARYVDSGYTPTGEFVRPTETLFAGLSDQETTLVSNIALQTSRAGEALWIRAVVLRCRMLADERAWQELGTIAALLDGYDWHAHREEWVHHHALEELAGDLVAAGATDVALQLQLHFLQVARMECGVEENETNLHSLSLVYTMLGDTYRDMGDLDDALHYYQADRDLTEMMIRRFGAEKHMRTLSVIYNRIGMCLLDMDETEQALHVLEQGWAIVQQLLEKAPTAEARRDASFTALELALVMRQQKNRKKMRFYIETAVEQRRLLCAESRTASSVMELAFAIHKQSYVKPTRPGRIKVTEEALVLCREGMKLRGNAADMITLIEILETLGQERCAGGDFEAGFAAFEEAVAVQATLAEMRGTTMERQQLIMRLLTYMQSSARSGRTTLDRLLPRIRSEIAALDDDAAAAQSYGQYVESVIGSAHELVRAMGRAATLEEIQVAVVPLVDELLGILRTPLLRVYDDVSFQRMLNASAAVAGFSHQIESFAQSVECRRIAVDAIFAGYRSPDEVLFLHVCHDQCVAAAHYAQQHGFPSYVRIFETIRLRCEAIDPMLAAG